MSDDMELVKKLRPTLFGMVHGPDDEDCVNQVLGIIERLTAEVASLEEARRALIAEVRELTLSQITIQGQAWDNHTRAEAAEAEAARLREENMKMENILISLSDDENPDVKYAVREVLAALRGEEG